jgi:hypothetical protein
MRESGEDSGRRATVAADDADGDDEGAAAAATTEGAPFALSAGADPRCDTLRTTRAAVAIVSITAPPPAA